MTSVSPAPDTAAAPVCFYHWRTELAPDSMARALLRRYGSDRLYVKVFDLSWQAGRAQPSALVDPGDTTGLPPLVPVVFITNEVFARQDPTRLDTLADQVLRLAEDLIGTRFNELQIDCDWTAGTQVSYFAFLRAVGERLGPKRLSCTLRLHQYRDRSRQGIPPADRGVLMAYNTGDLDDWATANSIVDTAVVKHYLAGQPPYPLPLDLALAVYDWAAVYRRGRLAYLVSEPPLADLADTARFAPLDDSGLRYRVRRGTYLDGTYLYTDDLLRREIARPRALDGQLRLLRRYVRPAAGQRVILFRIGSRLWR